MAHIRLLHDNSAAIFSPSIARIAASTARDWSFVDNWLASKLGNRKGPLPPFERNPDTLKVLLALASLNEAADDQRRLLARADQAALQELGINTQLDDDNNKTQDNNDGGLPAIKEDILGAIESALRKDGSNALDALARLSAEAGTPQTTPSELGRHMLRLQGLIHEIDQMKARVETMERHFRNDNESATQLLHSLQGDEYKPPSDMAKQNLDVQRKIKSMSAQLPDLLDRVANLEASIGGSSHPEIEHVLRQEQALLALVARKEQLEAQISFFAGLPADPDAARSELDSMRRQLRGVTTRRDSQFASLVERENPLNAL